MKWSGLTVIAAFVSTIVSTLPAEVLIRPNDPNINYFGRFDLTNSSTAATFNWPGSSIEAAFPGPSIGVELNDGGGSYFNVEIDGVLADSLSPSTVTRRTIRTNLSSANHTIRIILRTNGRNCSFGGFYLADGKSLAAKPASPVRKMEFIGDSWTAGDVIGSTTSNDLRYFNAALTYARLTSMAFKAQDKLIARGGCGLVTSNGGAATMPVRYLKTLCDGSLNWNFSSWTPDVVTIFLGINDFNNGVTDANFIAAYKNFINTVRGYYPDVPLVLIGLKDNINGKNILADVQAVAQSFQKVHVFSSPVTLANAKALWQHPNQAQNRQIADSLFRVIQRATGWDTAGTVPIRVHVPLQKTPQAQAGDHGVILSVQDKVAFHPELRGVQKEIIVYDCSGRPQRKFVSGKQTVSLRRDIGLSAGMHIISIKRR